MHRPQPDPMADSGLMRLSKAKWSVTEATCAESLSWSVVLLGTDGFGTWLGLGEAIHCGNLVVVGRSLSRMTRCG